MAHHRDRRRRRAALRHRLKRGRRQLLLLHGRRRTTAATAATTTAAGRLAAVSHRRRLCAHPIVQLCTEASCDHQHVRAARQTTAARRATASTTASTTAASATLAARRSAQEAEAAVRAGDEDADAQQQRGLEQRQLETRRAGATLLLVRPVGVDALEAEQVEVDGRLLPQLEHVEARHAIAALEHRHAVPEQRHLARRSQPHRPTAQHDDRQRRRRISRRRSTRRRRRRLGLASAASKRRVPIVAQVEGSQHRALRIAEVVAVGAQLPQHADGARVAAVDRRRAHLHGAERVDVPIERLEQHVHPADVSAHLELRSVEEGRECRAKGVAAPRRRCRCRRGGRGRRRSRRSRLARTRPGADHIGDGGWGYRTRQCRRDAGRTPGDPRAEIGLLRIQRHRWTRVVVLVWRQRGELVVQVVVLLELAQQLRRLLCLLRSPRLRDLPCATAVASRAVGLVALHGLTPLLCELSFLGRGRQASLLLGLPRLLGRRCGRLALCLCFLSLLFGLERLGTIEQHRQHGLVLRPRRLVRLQLHCGHVALDGADVLVYHRTIALAGLIGRQREPRVLTSLR